jgi:hypothetical protein
VIPSKNLVVCGESGMASHIGRRKFLAMMLLMMGGLGRSWSGAEIRNVRW